MWANSAKMVCYHIPSMSLQIWGPPLVQLPILHRDKTLTLSNVHMWRPEVTRMSVLGSPLPPHSLTH